MPKLSRHVIPISGKDSLCTAIVQQQKCPSLQYEYLFCDTGMELPETYKWLNRVESALGIRIDLVGRSLSQVIDLLGKLPGNTYRFCTKMCKVRPIHAYLGEDEQIVQYLGFRADEANRLPTSIDTHNPQNVTNRYPLIEEGIDLKGVYAILDAAHILPPDFFWQRLYDDCYSRVGPVSRRFMEECPLWTRGYLFGWRCRSNCFLCFYQRLYEWVGLLEHHPGLFQKAEVMEQTYGSTRSDTRLERHTGDPSAYEDYYFNANWPLRKIREYAEDIYRKRVSDVSKLIVEARHVDDEDTIGMLTSCGAYCGK